jgi:Uri superfamily endonuclease
VTETPTPGVYHLIVRLSEERVVQVGRLGRISFPAGDYVYTGSALNGLEARLARHRRWRKKLRWHIDYLLRAAALIDVVTIPTKRRVECRRNRWVLRLPGAAVVAPRFGSSDCACPAHLVYFGGRVPDLTAGPGWREGR